MTQPVSFHDVGLLSAYLDNQLSLADKERLESRLKNEPQLRSILDDLSKSRELLRKLPARRAPRNFMLTPKMAGVKPPLPRAFPFFRFASVIAALLFIFVFTANLSIPAIAVLRAAAPLPAYGMGGGGGPASSNAAPQAPAAAAPLAPAATPQADTASAVTPTAEARLLQAAPTQSAELSPSTGAAPQPGTQSKSSPAPQVESQPPSEKQPIQFPIPALFQFGLLGLAVFSAGIAYFLRVRAESSWYKAWSLKPGKPTTRQIFIFILILLVLALLAFSIYYFSTVPFYMPVARTNTFPVGQVAGDKGLIVGGDKGTGPAVGAQNFTLTPGLGYNFSSADAAGLATAIDFPADIFNTSMLVSYIPGMSDTPPAGTYFVNHAFSLIPADKNSQPLVPYTITIDYGDDVASAVPDQNSLLLYWWSGNDWQDSAGTCTPGSSYERSPDLHRISVPVCKMGTFILAAP